MNTDCLDSFDTLLCVLNFQPPADSIMTEYLNIFKQWHLGCLKYIAWLIFIIAMYFSDIKKTEKFQWPCGLQDL